VRRTSGVTLLLAVACGLIVANLYYSQPLVGLIAPSIGLPLSAASLIVTVTQVGYCAGLLFLVPLGDLVENRQLVLWTLCGAVIALCLATAAHSAAAFLAAALLLGLGAVAVQMLVPMAAHLASDANRGSVVGNVMSGLLVGIMLSRPLAGFVASAFGWRMVFAGSAVAMLVLGLILRWLLPVRRPARSHGYGELIASLWTLLRDTPLLRRRALYQSALFAVFTLYWTAVPIVLAGPYFNLSQRGIALFSLAGVAGALAAPAAGRLADRGHTRMATGIAIALVAVSFPLSRIGNSHSITMLLVGGILLDLGVQANLVLGQRAIYEIGSHLRSRLNGIFMALFFVGGGLGSSVASIAVARGGWPLVSWIGFALPVAALLFFATESRSAPQGNP
jgi:predicted MFS family arabinose efflux permease